MIIIDTDVISEVIHRKAAPAVLSWWRHADPAELHTTATVAAELLAGTAILPPGQRRDELESAIRQTLDEDFAQTILAFDLQASTAYAHVIAARRRAGRPISMADAQIAAVCLVHDAILATRNLRDFEGCGVRIVDPWQQ